MPIIVHFFDTDRSLFFSKDLKVFILSLMRDFGRPPFLQRLWASYRPAFTRSVIRVRSISEKAAQMLYKSMPMGLLVSMLFSNDTNSISFFLKSLINSINLLILLPRGSKR